MRHPARKCRLKGVSKLGLYIKVGNSRASTEPLQCSADNEVDFQTGHINRDYPSRLVNIEHDLSPNFVGTLDNSLDVLDKGALEYDVGDWYEGSALIDGLKQRF